jgi:hypothetical protein
MDAEKVLLALAETGNLTKACRQADVSKTTFLRWCDEDVQNADRYVRAREAGLDAEADRAIEEALTAEDAQLGRLALDARKWYLSKLLPKKYGDKQLVGSDPENPLPSGVTVTFK